MERHARPEPGKCCYVFNRGIPGTNIFVEGRNHAYFLDPYPKYVQPIIDTFAYCLLRNHFSSVHPSQDADRDTDLRGLGDLEGL